MKSDTFRPRAKLVAIEEEMNVHVHGCFGRVHPPDASEELWCESCGKRVSSYDVVTPHVDRVSYHADVSALIDRIDELEEQIATMEDERWQRNI